MARTKQTTRLSVRGGYMHPDLKREREGASFKPNEMTRIMYGDRMLAKLQNLLRLVEGNSAFDTSDLWHMTRTERYNRACERGEEFVRLVRENDLLHDDESLSALELILGEDMFVNLHLTMFIPALEKLADDEQLKVWLPLARDFRMLGTYAQTELAHGSNVPALQTTAELDLETDEWVLNTPTIQDTKWWPGGLGKSCTHCILMARMKIKGTDYGVHAYLLQVRDSNTHRSLKGVTLMDIGQKMGYNGMDNGGMQLDHVRIPRRNLLGRFFQVDKDGTYKTVGNQRMLYATMTYTRKQMICFAGPSLAKAAVTAIRYSAVRRQFPELKGKLPTSIADLGTMKEAQVLDYLTQQFALFPILATAVGFIFAGHATEEFYNETLAAAKEGVFDRFQELHVFTSSLKGTMTLLTAESMEVCRRSTGGHGFLLAGGIASAYTSYLPQATYEGDFVVLSIQCGRAMIKLVEDKMKGKDIPHIEGSTYEYVVTFDPFAEREMPTEVPDFDDLDAMVEMYKQRCCALVYKTAEKLAMHLANDKTHLETLDEGKIEMTRITKAHCHLIVLQSFLKNVRLHEGKNDACVAVLRRLCKLYAMFYMEQSFFEFVWAKTAAPDHHDVLLERIKTLLKEIRPDAIAMCDSFSFTDEMLNSALGRFDGNVYEALYDAAQRDHLNRSDVCDAYYQAIQYILHPERKTPVAKL